MNTQMTLLSLIWERLNIKNQNFIAIIVGGTGTGKSWAAIRLSELLDKKFSSDRIFFNYDGFRKLLNDKNLYPGAMMVWDEAGAGEGGASREGMTKKNRQVGKILQTFRNRNYGLIITVPDVSMVDKQIRSLAHYSFEPWSMNRRMGTNRLRVRRLSTDLKRGKTYFLSQDLTVNGKIKSIKNIIVKKPSKELIRDYEEKKLSFQKQLYNKDLDGKKRSSRKVILSYDKLKKMVLDSGKEYNAYRILYTDYKDKGATSDICQKLMKEIKSGTIS